MRKEGALMVANKELSEKQKEKVEKIINYMFYELYTKRMSAEAAQEIAKATYEKVKNEYELGKGHLSNEDEKNLREWIYGGIREAQGIIKIITDALPTGKAGAVITPVATTGAQAKVTFPFKRTEDKWVLRPTRFQEPLPC